MPKSEMQKNLPMLQALRSLVKNSEVTYEQLGQKMKVSPDTIKRLLNGKVAITLERVSQICDILGIDMFELARLSKYGDSSQPDFLSWEQETALAENEILFVVFYLTVMEFSYERIIKEYKITKDQLLKIALRLESLKILELHPKNKLKMRVYRKSRWNLNGPLHHKYMIPMAVDFVTDVYRTPDSFKFFFNCPMSKDSKETVIRKMRELGREIEHLSEMDLNVKNRADTTLNILMTAKPWMPEPLRRYQR